MDTIYGLVALVGLLAGQMCDEQYSVREYATWQLSALVNEHDCPHLISPLLKSSNLELRSRVRQVLAVYYNPRPSNTAVPFPSIISYKGVNNKYWEECFLMAFQPNYYEQYSLPRSIRVTHLRWLSDNVDEERNAAKFFIRKKWETEHLTRKQVVAILDDMAENERRGLYWKMPPIENPYSNCLPYEPEIPFPKGVFK